MPQSNRPHHNRVFVSRLRKREIRDICIREKLWRGDGCWADDFDCDRSMAMRFNVQKDTMTAIRHNCFPGSFTRTSPTYFDTNQRLPRAITVTRNSGNDAAPVKPKQTWLAEAMRRGDCDHSAVLEKIAGLEALVRTAFTELGLKV